MVEFNHYYDRSGTQPSSPFLRVLLWFLRLTHHGTPRVPLPVSPSTYTVVFGPLSCLVSHILHICDFPTPPLTYTILITYPPTYLCIYQPTYPMSTHYSRRRTEVDDTHLLSTICPLAYYLPTYLLTSYLPIHPSMYLVGHPPTQYLPTI